MSSPDCRHWINARQERYRVPCGSRYCPSCGAKWAKDQRIRAVAAAKALTGDCALVTITGPGNEYFCPRARDGQRIVRSRKAWWNFTARERFEQLHRKASRAPRECAKYLGADWRVLYRTWEWQRRRVLHVHLVLPYGTKAERAATGDYVRRLWLAARDHGFGFVLGGDRDDEPGWSRPPKVKAMEVNAVAAYVSKYVSKAGDARNGMRSVARAAGMRGSVLHIAPKLLAASGVSMTTLRNRRRIWGRYPWARSSRRCWQEACVVDAVQRGHAPLSPDGVEAIRAACARGVPGRISLGARDPLREPTRAPEPLGLGGYDPWRTLPGRVLGAVLASSSVHVPEPENLGWIRTEVVGLTG